MGEALRQEVAETDIKVTLIEPGHGRHALLRRTARAARWSPTTSPAR